MPFAHQPGYARIEFSSHRILAVSTTMPSREQLAAAKTVGRGTGINTPNRFERIHVQPEFEHLDEDDQRAALVSKVKTEYFVDASQSVVSENNSPDISFRFSINPYRGCAHGCSYCCRWTGNYRLEIRPGLGLGEVESTVVVPSFNLVRRIDVEKVTRLCNHSAIVTTYKLYVDISKPFMPPANYAFYCIGVQTT